MSDAAKGAPPGEAEPRGRRRGAIAAGVGVTLLAVMVGVVAWRLDPWARERIRREAAARGVRVTSLGELELGWERVAIRPMSFTFAALDGVTVEVEELYVELDGLTPARVVARGAEVELVGGALELLLELSALGGRHPELFALPAEASDLTLRWRQSPGDEPWLVAKKGALVPEPGGGGRLEARRTEVVGLDVGKVAAAWDTGGARASFGFGEREVVDAPVRLVVDHSVEPVKAELELVPTPLADLSRPLAIVLRSPKTMEVAAKAELSLFRDGRVEGPVAVDVQGYRPPVPKELAGIVFGDQTAVRADVALDPTWRRVELTDVEVEHGAIRATGGGTIIRGGEHATLQLEMKASLGCAQLATAAIASNVGGDLGGTLGGLAGAALQGSVSMTVKVAASTEDLAGATIHKAIGIGCGLRPLTVPDELPELPPLPKLPPLPLLPRFEL